MESRNGTEAFVGIDQVLGNARRKGVRLWLQNGALHYRAPRGVLTAEEIEQLQRYRESIISLLEGLASNVSKLPSLAPHAVRNRAPLSFSQEARWYHHELGRRPGLRQIACAIHLAGPLDLQALRDSLTYMLRRHEALRTRIAAMDQGCVQIVTESGNCELQVEDLMHLDERGREREIERLIDEVILEPTRVDVDPLLAVRLAKLRRDEHVLILAMEHIISDGVSLNILVRDLVTAYRHAAVGRPWVLPLLPIQFADYALWQRSTHESWVRQHGPYWIKRLAGCHRLRFPHALASPMTRGWGTVPVRIGRSLKAELSVWCRARCTTLVMAVLTAYVALVLRWCEVGEAVIRYQSDGRVVPEVHDTIGFFASVLNLRLQLLETDSLLDLLRRTTEEYCNAYGHADSSYLDAQASRPEIVGNPSFNWVPQEPQSTGEIEGTRDPPLIISSVPFRHPVLGIYELDAEPCILLYERDDCVEGGVQFPLNRFSVQEMERFTGNFFLFLKELISAPDQRVRDIALR